MVGSKRQLARFAPPPRHESSFGKLAVAIVLTFRQEPGVADVTVRVVVFTTHRRSPPARAHRDGKRDRGAQLEDGARFYIDSTPAPTNFAIISVNVRCCVTCTRLGSSDALLGELFEVPSCLYGRRNSLGDRRQFGVENSAYEQSGTDPLTRPSTSVDRRARSATVVDSWARKRFDSLNSRSFVPLKGVTDPRTL